MSRKLIFIKGVLMCFSCYKNKDLSVSEVEEYLRELALMKPLDFILSILIKDAQFEKETIALFNTYNKYLTILNDPLLRNELENLNMLKVYENPTFLKARELCDNFQSILDEIFIKKDSLLKEFIIKYGIF